jgi:hypothetical protein
MLTYNVGRNSCQRKTFAKEWVLYDWKLRYTCPRRLWFLIRIYQLYLKFSRSCQFMNSEYWLRSHTKIASYSSTDPFPLGRSLLSLNRAVSYVVFWLPDVSERWKTNESERMLTDHNFKIIAKLKVFYFSVKIICMESKYTEIDGLSEIRFS